MIMQSEIARKLQSAFEPQQAEVLLEVISLSYDNLVKVGDFSELKAIVQDLAESQRAMGESQRAMGVSQQAMGVSQQAMGETQASMGESLKALAAAQERTSGQIEVLTAAQERTSGQIEVLTAAQERTSGQIEEMSAAQERNTGRIEGLTTAQERTSSQIEEMSAAVAELAVAQQRTERQVEKLTSTVGDVRSEIGGMSRSMSYALENEAYRALPAFLLDKHGIDVTERLIRAPINDEEINFFGHAVRDGRPVLIVGESKQRLDERRSSKREEDRIFSQLEAKANVVRAAYPDEEIVLLLITHYARPEFLRTAAARDIVVVQSFEW